MAPRTYTKITFTTPEVHETVDAFALNEPQGLPSPSTQTRQIIDSAVALKPKPTYAPASSSLADFLRDIESSPSSTSLGQAPYAGAHDRGGSSRDTSAAMVPLRNRGGLSGDVPAAVESAEARSSSTSSGQAPSAAARDHGAPSRDASAAMVPPRNRGVSSRDVPAAVASTEPGSSSPSHTGEPVSTTVVKKKRAEMGLEEKRVARKAAEERGLKISNDVAKFLSEQDALIVKLAEENNITTARAKQMASMTPSLKQKKQASNYNILLHFKAKEVNEGLGRGKKIPLKEVHTLLKDDPEFMDLLDDKAAMAELREKYDEDKGEKNSRVSKRSAARVIAAKLNLLQQEADYMAETTDAASFGVVVRGTYESTVQSGYHGRGPADEFLRKHFKVGIQEFTYLFQDYCCSTEKLGRRQLYHNEMVSEIVQMVGRGLREITGVVNAQMSYSAYGRSIIKPYAVDLLGWPDDIPRVQPQKLNAEQVKTLYQLWSSGGCHWVKMTNDQHRSAIRKLEQEGELDPKPRKERSDKGVKRKRGGDSDDSSDDDEGDEGVDSPPAKKRVKKHTGKPNQKDGKDGKSNKGKAGKSNEGKAGKSKSNGGKAGKLNEVKAGKSKEAKKVRAVNNVPKKAAAKKSKGKVASSKKGSRKFVVSDDDDEESSNEEDEEDEGDFSA